MGDNGRKDVNIKVPCMEVEMKPKAPEQLKFHAVIVPSEALPEVQEVLKKYQKNFDALNEAIKKHQAGG